MRRLAIALLVLSGCAHTTTSAATTTTKPPTLRQRLDSMTTSIEKRDFAGALRDTDAWLATNPDDDTKQLIYNCRTWIRWGSGDKAGALAENEKVRELAGHDAERGRLRNYWWDRAYLEAEAGKLDEADRSRAEFFAIATKPDDANSKHVLDAWLAFRRGDGDKARAEASAVDPAKDDDLQDLYVLACALESGGDATGAASIRDRIRNGYRYPMKPTILQQMARDTNRCQ